MLTVLLVDVNDNRPLFVDEQGLLVAGYNTTVNETAVNMTILTVRAVDDDSGRNGLVTYSFDSLDDERYFNINPKTGVLSVKDLPARSIQRTFFLRVTAADHGLPSRKGFARITVSVLEVNEYVPSIVTSSPNGVLLLYENTTVGTVVLTFNVTDRDGEGSGMVSVSIVNASTNWLSLSSNKSSLELSQIVDFEVSMSIGNNYNSLVLHLNCLFLL